MRTNKKTKKINDLFEDEKREKTRRSLYLDKNLLESLEKVSSQTGRSVNAVIAKILEDWVKELK